MQCSNKRLKQINSTHSHLMLHCHCLLHQILFIVSATQFTRLLFLFIFKVSFKSTFIFIARAHFTKFTSYTLLSPSLPSLNFHRDSSIVDLHLYFLTNFIQMIVNTSSLVRSLIGRVTHQLNPDATGERCHRLDYQSLQ